MRTLKAIGLGTVFSTVALCIYAYFAFMRSHSSAGPAIGLGAIKSGTALNVYFWLILISAYGAAFWLVRHR